MSSLRPSWHFGPLDRHRARERARADARFAAVAALEERLDRYLAGGGGAAGPVTAKPGRGTGAGVPAEADRR